MPVLGPVPCLATCSYENCTSLGTHRASVSLSENDHQNIASARTSLFDFFFFYHKSALNTFNRTNTEEGNNTAGLLNLAHNISQQPPTLYSLKVISKDSSLFCRLSTRSSHPAHHCTPISHEKKCLSPQHRVEGDEGKYISLCLPRPFPFQTWKLLGHSRIGNMGQEAVCRTHRGFYLVKPRTSFLVMSHLLNILGKYLTAVSQPSD